MNKGMKQNGSNVMESVLKYPKHIRLKDAFTTRLLVDGKNADGEKGRIASLDRAFELLEKRNLNAATSKKPQNECDVNHQLVRAVTDLEDKAHALNKDKHAPNVHILMMAEKIDIDVHILMMAEKMDLRMLKETANLLKDETAGADILKALQSHGQTMMNLSSGVGDVNMITKDPDVKTIVENFAKALFERGDLLVKFVDLMTII